MKKRISDFLIKNFKNLIFAYFGFIFLFLGFLLGIYLYFNGFNLLPLYSLLILGWIDGINPCAIGIMLLLLGYLLVFLGKKRTAVFLGIIYIMVVYITYFLIGVAFGTFAHKIVTSNFAKYFEETIGALLVIFGILNIKDFFFEGMGPTLQIPQKSRKFISNLVEKASLPATIILGIVVTFLETPCSFPLYMGIVTLLQNFYSFSFLFFFYLLFYNLIFVLPLILILYLVSFADKLMVLKEFQHIGRKWLKLIIGSCVFVFGVFLILQL